MVCEMGGEAVLVPVLILLKCKWCNYIAVMTQLQLRRNPVLVLTQNISGTSAKKTDNLPSYSFFLLALCARLVKKKHWLNVIKRVIVNNRVYYSGFDHPVVRRSKSTTVRWFSAEEKDLTISTTIASLNSRTLFQWRLKYADRI